MSQGIIDQLKTAFDVYSTNPNAAKQVVAASAQGQPTGLKGLAAAAALQQAPQAQTPAPQGTVMQHLAQQQGIMGQLPAMQGQLASAPPPQEMGMAGGGLVSFAEGGILPPDVLDAIQEHFAQGGTVRGFAGGNSLQGLSEAEAAKEANRLNQRIKWQRLGDSSAKIPAPEAESLRSKLGKVNKTLGKFGMSPLGAFAPAGIGFMFDKLLDPEFQKQYAEDWEENMPSWLGGRGEPQAGKEAPKAEDYTDIMQGEAGETFPGAGLASLKQVDKQEGKQEPSTGATVTPRAQPIPEAKETGYKLPEEQTIEINRQGAPAPEGASSLMPGESYGIPSLGGLEGQVEMLDKLRGLKDMKMSEAQAKRLEEMQTGAKEDKWLGALMGMISGTLGSSSPYLGQAIGQGGIQALAAYQQGAREEEDIARKAFDIYGQEEQAPRLEHARNVEEIMKLLGKKAELASEERRAANRGGLSYGERSALQTQRDTAAEARARLYGENRDITNREATARQSADTEYKAAMNKGENPDYLAILEKYRRQLGLAEGGLGGGPLGGSGGLTVTRQGIRQ